MNVLYWRQKEHKDTRVFLDEIRGLYYKKTGFSASFLYCAKETADGLSVSEMTIVVAPVNRSAYILSTEGGSSGSA